VGFFPANAAGDDIEVYTDDERTQVATKFHGLRQQAEKDTEEPYCCISDFVAPKGSGIKDYIGMFACTAGIGLDEVRCAAPRRAGPVLAGPGRARPGWAALCCAGQELPGGAVAPCSCAAGAYRCRRLPLH
jgi:hypothetical protein